MSISINCAIKRFTEACGEAKEQKVLKILKPTCQKGVLLEVILDVFFQFYAVKEVQDQVCVDFTKSQIGIHSVEHKILNLQMIFL